MEEDYVSKAFITLLALKDSAQEVDTNAFRLGRRCWPAMPAKEAEQRAMMALKILCEPDKLRSEPQEFDGRRIEKTSTGYLILNGQKYEELMRQVSRRAYKAKKEREYRLSENYKPKKMKPKNIFKPTPTADENGIL